MRRPQQTLRRIALVAAIGVLGAVPVALAVSADPFGAPEVVDPILRPLDGVSPVLGADADGNAYWYAFIRDQQSDDQPAVYERCGATAASWKPTIVGPGHQNLVPPRHAGRSQRHRDGDLADQRRSGLHVLLLHEAARGRVGRAAGDRGGRGRELRPVRAERRRRCRRVVGGPDSGGDANLDPSGRRNLGPAGDGGERLPRPPGGHECDGRRHAVHEHRDGSREDRVALPAGRRVVPGGAGRARPLLVPGHCRTSGSSSSTGLGARSSSRATKRRSGRWSTRTSATAERGRRTRGSWTTTG